MFAFLNGIAVFFLHRWKSLRQKLNPAFSPAKVKAMFPPIQRVCMEFNHYIEKRTNEDIDVSAVTLTMYNLHQGTRHNCVLVIIVCLGKTHLTVIYTTD